MNKKVREVALYTLEKIEKDEAYSNLLLRQTINKAKLHEKDIRLLTEIVYGTIQRQNTIDYYLQSFVKKGIDSLDLWVKVLLRLSIYQIVYLTRVPPRAVVHEAVQIAKKRGHKGISGMVNGVLRSFLRKGVPPLEEVKDEIERYSLQWSFPKWLIRRWIEQYGVETTKSICMSSTTRPHVTVRVNKRMATVDQMVELLQKEGFVVKKGVLSPDALIIEKGNIFQSKFYKEGYVTGQDESSMLVARALNVQPSMTVLDACAAPGGKSTHIAEQMDDEGTLLAFDLHPHKVNLIQNQAKRLQLTSIKAETIDIRHITKHVPDMKFDRILLDAPCSGLGVIRRKPDIKWRKSVQDIEKIQSIQQEFLQVVAPFVSSGGILIYSTCTIDRWENEENVLKFLKTHPDFSLDSSLEHRLPRTLIERGRYEKGMVSILPHDFQTDGFFIASFKRR